MNPQKQNSFSFYADWQAAIYISISENSAIWSSRNPPWLGGTPTVDSSTLPPPPATSPNNNKQNSCNSITEVNLSASTLPLLNTPLDFTCTLLSKSSNKLDNCVAYIDLPEGAKFISGELEWKGSLEAGKSVSFTAQVLFEKIGKWAIKAFGIKAIDSDNSYVDFDAIHVKVGKDNSSFGCSRVDRVV